MLKSSLGQERGDEEVPMDESREGTTHWFFAKQGHLGGSSPLPFPSFDAYKPDLRSYVKYAVPMAASSTSQTNKSQDMITLY